MSAPLVSDTRALCSQSTAHLWLEVHTEWLFLLQTLLPTTQPRSSEGLCPHYAQTPKAHPRLLLSIACFLPARQCRLLFVQQCQTRSRLANAANFSALRWSNHNFSNEICTPSEFAPQILSLNLRVPYRAALSLTVTLFFQLIV